MPSAPGGVRIAVSVLRFDILSIEENRKCALEPCSPDLQVYLRVLNLVLRILIVDVYYRYRGNSVEKGEHQYLKPRTGTSPKYTADFSPLRDCRFSQNGC